MSNTKEVQKSFSAIVAIILLVAAATGILVQPAFAKDGVVEIFGPIKTLPSGNNLTGTWMIGTQTVTVNSATVIKQELGTAKVGAVVEAKATPQAGGGLLATKIEVKQSVGGGGYIMLHGLITALPGASGFIGDWTVGGRQVTVTTATLLDQTRGAFKVGTRVEVEGFLQTDGTISASKVKTRPEDQSEDFKFFGTIGSLPAAANLIGDWTISGRTVHVTATTNLEQERQRFAVGVYVIVEGFPQNDGSVTAKEIKTVIVSTASAASFSVGRAAPETIVAGFGDMLAGSMQVAVGLPLPTTLAGTTVNVKDSLGAERAAPLFFVSPNQVNYQIPAGAAPGLATVSIGNDRGDLVTGTIQIESTVPGLFSANSSGQGLAAALALRVKPNGEQQYEPIAVYDSALAAFVARPIDVSSDDVYLILYGTGLRHRSSLSAVSAKIGGSASQVIYAGGQGSYAGLDQLNVQLGRHLTGRGEVEIEVEVEGKLANKVKVHIR